MDVANFLGTISGDKPLSQITVPGSHDAGVYDEDAKSLKFVSTSKAICQSKNIYDQCMAGSRYFDIRIEKFGGALKAHHTAPLPIKFGATGGELERMLGDLVRFVKGHTDEFVIARFSKSTNHADIVKEVIRIGGTYLFTGDANIAKTKLSAVRGKIICVFASDFKKYIDPGKGIHRFATLDKKDGRNNGMFVCGKYADSTDMTKVYAKAFAHLNDHDGHSEGDHLNLTYWTQTGGKIRDNTLSGAHPLLANALDEMRKRTPPMSPAAKQHWDALEKVIDRKIVRDHGMSAYQADSGSLALVKAARQRSGLTPPKLPNIVMYDFINERSSEDIITLNFPALRIGTV